MNKKIKITWNDTRVFSPEQKQIRLSTMMTVGILEKEYEQYYLIKNPETINTETEKAHPLKQPSFYLIPKGMVVSIVTL